MRAMVGEDAWRDFFVNPLSQVLDRTFHDDVVRGIVQTDALIGTFSYAADPSLRQNACFLYHVIGNGTGSWNLPVGGMGAVTKALAQRARDLGAQIDTGVTVQRISSDGESAVVAASDASGQESVIHASMVLAGCAPRELDRLLARSVLPTPDWAEGAQIKVNMVLKRLPRLRDEHVDPEEAFAGTVHVNESAQQLEAAYTAATTGHLADPVPCEAYCHSLGDRSILGSDLVDSDAQTLTVFALQTPHRLFAGPSPRVRREQAQAAVLASLSSMLAEPIEDCLLLDGDGLPCIQVSTTADLEQDLALPAGNIFHTPLDLPFATRAEEAGKWGVETNLPNIALCGSGARRGGGVSGIPGHNAARYALEFLARKSSTS